MPPARRVRFRINGRQFDQPVDPGQPLSTLLGPESDRARLEPDCRDGACGRCAVLLGGRQVRACLAPATPCDDAIVTSVEGLTNHGFLSRVQQAFLRLGAAPCGRCTPAMLIAATELLARAAAPARAELAAGIDAVRCRCGDYEAILDAMASAVDVTPDPAVDPRDGPHADIVTGRSRLALDDASIEEIGLDPCADRPPADLESFRDVRRDALAPGVARGFGWGGGFAARLAEVGFDEETGEIRVHRVVAPLGPDASPASLRRNTVRGLMAVDPSGLPPGVGEMPACAFHVIQDCPPETAETGARATAFAVLAAIRALGIDVSGRVMPTAEEAWRARGGGRYTIS